MLSVLEVWVDRLVEREQVREAKRQARAERKAGKLSYTPMQGLAWHLAMREQGLDRVCKNAECRMCVR